MLKSPFVEHRKIGILPQDIPTEITDSLVDRIFNLPEEQFISISPIFDYPVEKKKGVFDTDLCEECGERTFVHKLQEANGKKVCIPCAEKQK